MTINVSDRYVVHHPASSLDSSSEPFITPSPTTATTSTVTLAWSSRLAMPPPDGLRLTVHPNGAHHHHYGSSGNHSLSAASPLTSPLGSPNGLSITSASPAATHTRRIGGMKGSGGGYTTFGTSSGPSTPLPLPTTPFSPPESPALVNDQHTDSPPISPSLPLITNAVKSGGNSYGYGKRLTPPRMLGVAAKTPTTLPTTNTTTTTTNDRNNNNNNTNNNNSNQRSSVNGNTTAIRRHVVPRLVLPLPTTFLPPSYHSHAPPVALIGISQATHQAIVSNDQQYGHNNSYHDIHQPYSTHYHNARDRDDDDNYQVAYDSDGDIFGNNSTPNSSRSVSSSSTLPSARQIVMPVPVVAATNVVPTTTSTIVTATAVMVPPNGTLLSPTSASSMGQNSFSNRNGNSMTAVAAVTSPLASSANQLLAAPPSPMMRPSSTSASASVGAMLGIGRSDRSGSNAFSANGSSNENDDPLWSRFMNQNESPTQEQVDQLNKELELEEERHANEMAAAAAAAVRSSSNSHQSHSSHRRFNFSPSHLQHRSTMASQRTLSRTTGSHHGSGNHATAAIMASSHHHSHHHTTVAINNTHDDNGVRMIAPPGANGLQSSPSHDTNSNSDTVGHGNDQTFVPPPLVSHVSFNFGRTSP
jgi:hypothetical protein